MFVEILPDGVFKMLEQTGKDVDTGKWEYDADTKILKVSWGEVGFTSYSVEAVETDYLTLKLGDILFKYKRE